MQGGSPAAPWLWYDSTNRRLKAAVANMDRKADRYLRYRKKVLNRTANPTITQLAVPVAVILGVSMINKTVGLWICSAVALGLLGTIVVGMVLKLDHGLLRDRIRRNVFGLAMLRDSVEWEELTKALAALELDFDKLMRDWPGTMRASIVMYLTETIDERRALRYGDGDTDADKNKRATIAAKARLAAGAIAELLPDK